MTRQCSECGVEKALGEYTTGKAKCKPCTAALAAAWRAANPEVARTRAAAWRAANPERVRAAQAAWANTHPGGGRAASARAHTRRRLAALAALGGCCVQCGSTDSLEIDHIEGDGGEHRRVEGQSAYLLRLASTGKADPRLQLLCHDCHATKTGDENRARRALA